MTRSCPDEEMLVDYIEDRLPESQRSEMEKHLSDCDSCFQEFVLSRSIVRGGDNLGLEPVPKRVTQNAINMLKKQGFFPDQSPLARAQFQVKKGLAFLSGFLQDTFQWRWHLSPVRSTQKMVTQDFFRIRKRFPDFEADIEIDKTGDKKANVKVFLVEGSIRKGIRVTLKSGEREMSSQLLDSGYVVFEDLSFARYRLNFSENGKINGSYSFEIK